MEALQAAQEFLAKALSGDVLRDAYKALPVEVQTLYNKLRKDAFFAPENAVVDKRQEVLSPSGKYKLVITPFTTGPGSWNYSQGIVYRCDDDKPIAEVRRNYGGFPFLFIEGHTKGDFVVVGEDYQGQTVIELMTGARRDHLSKGTEKGHGFCWGSYTYDVATQLLVVCGCIWACPYEYRFYDFSDPMRGWPELSLGNGPVDANDDEKAPEIDPDGTIRCFQTRYVEDDDDETDEEATKNPHAPIVDVIQTFRREGLKLTLVEEWVSDYEKDKRLKNAEYEKKYREWAANFKATDPLYLAYATLVKDSALSPEEYESVGQIYEGWAESYPRPAQGERRWCRRIIYQSKKGGKGATVDLGWGVDKGPIKLDFFRDGKSDGDQFFEHSVEGMQQAFARAKEYSNV